MQMLELPPSVHPYFVGTQAHPCLTSRPLSPDPLFLGLVEAAIQRAYPQQVFSDMNPDTSGVTHDNTKGSIHRPLVAN